MVLVQMNGLGFSFQSLTHARGPGPYNWDRPTRAVKCVQRWSRRLRTSLTGLMACAAVYRDCLTGQHDIVIGVPVVERSGPCELAVPGMTSDNLRLLLRIERQG